MPLSSASMCILEYSYYVFSPRSVLISNRSIFSKHRTITALVEDPVLPACEHTSLFRPLLCSSKQSFTFDLSDTLFSYPAWSLYLLSSLSSNLSRYLSSSLPSSLTSYLPILPSPYISSNVPSPLFTLPIHLTYLPAYPSTPSPTINLLLS